MNSEITTIETAELEDVTGGFAWGALLSKASGLLGGLMGGSNINAQIGNNQRSAQANTAPVTLGDGSGITMPATGGGQ